jgi:hypothetical protein
MVGGRYGFVNPDAVQPGRYGSVSKRGYLFDFFAWVAGVLIAITLVPDSVCTCERNVLSWRAVDTAPFRARRCLENREWNSLYTMRPEFILAARRNGQRCLV